MRLLLLSSALLVAIVQKDAVQGEETLSIYELRLLNSAPLTDEDFANGKLIDQKTVERDYPIGFGGPTSPPEEYREQTRQAREVFTIWPNGIIPYTLDVNFNTADRAAIANSMAIIESMSCLTFVPAQGSTDLPRMDIVSENLGGYCYTTWYTDGGSGTYAEVRLSPSSSCTVERTIIHELFHGFSFYHTHTRADRDDYVQINYQNIISDQQDQFDYCTGCCCETWGFPYDCSSVQHYAKDQMSVNGGDSITALNPTTCVLLPFNEWNVYDPPASDNDWAMVDNQYGQFC